MFCKPEITRIAKEIGRIGLWDLLTGIPAGMSTFVAAAVLAGYLVKVNLDSEIFLWLLLLSAAIFSSLIGITRGSHAAPSALIQGLFVFGSAFWLWLNIYPDLFEIIKISYIFLLFIVIPLLVAVKVRDVRSR